MNEEKKYTTIIIEKQSSKDLAEALDLYNSRTAYKEKLKKTNWLKMNINLFLEDEKRISKD